MYPSLPSPCPSANIVGTFTSSVDLTNQCRGSAAFLMSIRIQPWTVDRIWIRRRGLCQLTGERGWSQSQQLRPWAWHSFPYNFCQWYGPGSGIRCSRPILNRIQDNFFWISDLIPDPTHIFLELCNNFWVGNTYFFVNLLKFLIRTCLRNLIIFNFVKFMARKKLRQFIYFFPPLFGVV